jgi:hypothetical protein
VNTANNRIVTLSLKLLSAHSVSTLSIDADLKNGAADQVTAETREGDGTVVVKNINLISDSKSPVTLTIADENSVIDDVAATKAESAMATYKLKAMRDQNGILRTVAYGQKAKPAVVAAPVAAQLGGFLTQINSYDQAFANLDMEMLMTREERTALDNANKYAMAEVGNNNKLAYNNPMYFDNGINRDSKGLWNRTYATFERVGLSGGPKIGNIAYGNFFGGDMGKKELRNGWKRQFSAYIGYNGSTQDFERQSIDQNGGTLGVMETWYKGNFFTALTANVSGNFADTSTDIGKERMAMIMAGVASKTGYNF